MQQYINEIKEKLREVAIRARMIREVRGFDHPSYKRAITEIDALRARWKALAPEAFREEE